MRTSKQLAAAFVVAVAGLGHAAATASSTPAATVSTYIVVLRDGVDPGTFGSGLVTGYDARVTHTYRFALNGLAARIPEAVLSTIQADPQVEYVVPDQPVTAAAQTVPPGIDRIDAELSATALIGGTNAGVDQRVAVDVAILDSGIDLNHPDLNVMTARKKSCTGSTGEDAFGHGTQMAGIVGALDNSIGTVGVAPGARLWPVQVLDSKGRGTFSTVLCGVDYVTQYASEVEVANMSLQASGSEPPGAGCTTGNAYHDGICRSVLAGVTYVAAAGNNAANAAGYVPAAFDEVVTVSAMPDYDGKPGGLGTTRCSKDVDDTFGNLSNFGADVDLIAPGVCIYSTNKGDGYTSASGTSHAAAHVSGAAALFIARELAAGRAVPSPATVASELQRSGTLYWNSADDKDGITEKLVNVAAY
ncbi:MAG: S8 family serine peptidase [Actinomycetota bacterium]